MEEIGLLRVVGFKEIVRVRWEEASRREAITTREVAEMAEMAEYKVCAATDHYFFLAILCDVSDSIADTRY